MSFNVGNIIREVYAYWNRPSEADLPQDDVVGVLNRKVNRLLLHMQLSDRNYLAKLSDPFSFLGQDRSLVLTGMDDMSAIVRVESRVIGGDEDAWGEEFITDFGAWNDAEDSSTDSVAFAGTAPNLTMYANRDVSTLEFRILYETGGVSLSGFSATVPYLQDFFRSTVFYGTAAEAGMLLAGLNSENERSRDKKVAYAEAKEAVSFDDFRKWLLNEPGQANTFREAFNSTRLGLGRARMFGIDNGDGGYYSRF